MKRGNTELPFWTLLFTLYYTVIVLLLTVSILAGLVMGRAKVSDAGGLLLLKGAFNYLLLAGFSVALWLRWRELRANFSARQLLGRNSLAALAVFGLIAAGPAWLPIHFVADGPLEWLNLYQFYLIFAGLIVLAPCFLIYSLGKALGEKDTEKEEMDEAKKY